ncbi:MAG: hypothetical protein IT184_05715 [Acidobacteria bacterium]|nr:hypothetical protein [Acidobacteriota bacterium]
MHATLIAGVAALLAFSMVYPFLPGRYDELAVPLSTMAQVFGVVGLALVPGGVLWLIVPRYGFPLALLATAIGTGVALVLALFATLSVGNAFGVLTLAIWISVLVRLAPRLKDLRRAGDRRFSPAPFYLVLLPTLAFGSQLALAVPATRWSRDRAMANAGELIADIEQYRTRHGSYPPALQAQHADYVPDVIGVEQYFYAPRGESYNLAFEQPRFLLDRFGTREWVVYNPRGEHRLYSHAARLLSSPDLGGSGQGWYASGETGHVYWRYFWFD